VNTSNIHEDRYAPEIWDSSQAANTETMFVSNFVKSGFECCLSNAGFWLYSVFETENEGDMLIGNVSWLHGVTPS
jgi:hypothetical protein